MNTLKKNSVLFVLAILTGWATVLLADDKAPAIRTQTRSVFIMPTSPKQGRDPFFPESTRVYDQMLAATRTNTVVELPPLSVPGISGTPGHLLAIINNHTFAAGDEGDVLTSAGNKVHVLCIEVEADHVIVEVNGRNQRLKLENQ